MDFKDEINNISEISPDITVGVQNTKNQSKSHIPKELIEQFRKNNVVLLIGAGLSVGAGLPTWNQLIKPLAERIGYNGDNLLKAAQFYENREGRNSLISYIRNKLDTTNVEITHNQRLISQLSSKIVLTTNIDDLIERAFREARKNINLVIGKTDLSFWDESKVNIVKLHGSYYHPESIIITEQDYNTVYVKNHYVFEQLRSLVLTKTLLIIGYSMSDPDFNQIFDCIAHDLEKNMRRPYLITFDLDEFIIEDLNKRGFHVINLSQEKKQSRDIILKNWLSSLFAEL